MTHRPIRPGIRVGPADPDDDTGDPAIRDAFALWASGVTVLAVPGARQTAGMTASAFTPLSLRPPLVLVCVHRDAPILPVLRDAMRFTVNILAADQRAVASAFADRFPVGRATPDENGVIDGCLASLICSLEEAHPGGDHAIVIGRITDVRQGRNAAPLLYHRREYRAGES